MEDMTMMMRLLYGGTPLWHERMWSRYNARVREWKQRDQPQRFYLWLAWLCIHPVAWTIYRIGKWRRDRRMRKMKAKVKLEPNPEPKVGDFVDSILPRLYAPMPSPADLFPVQPMPEPKGVVFFMNEWRKEVYKGTPWTHRWGWGWRRPDPYVYPQMIIDGSEESPIETTIVWDSMGAGT